ncbi:RagB/SusD family nutrient uptake outer membrane protein [Maribacter sp.]|uniref:RagB/SusD family nutrient uptake outer membrane protein n=1 Tax=Maribacter sp. TaxID=1897614 RepID=UPI00329A4206
MKKKYIYFSLLLTAMISCSDEFTTQPAVGALSDEALQNEVGLELLLTGAYSSLDGNRQNLAGSAFAYSPDNWWFDVISDDAHKGSTDGDQATLSDLEKYNINTSNDYVLGRWSALYAGVNRANAVINLIGELTDSDFTGKLAEARFLRGYANFELQKIYGAPAYISEENAAATEYNQPNPGDIWAQVEADFEFAIANLPDTQPEAGRPNSWTAKAFLGKTHLYQSDWTNALSLLQDVINNGPYALNTEFLDNFTAAGENATESVFAVQFSADDGLSFNGNDGGTLNFPGAGPTGTCCGFYQPSIDLSNAYETGPDGLPLLETFNDEDITNDYGIPSSEDFTPFDGNLDPRIDYTMGRRGIQYNGYGINAGMDWIRSTTADVGSSPYLPKKNIYQFDEIGVNAGTGDWGQQRSGINYNIMRFADVLLMAAEAAVETGDLTTALDYVNQVRNRAKNMTYVPEYDEENLAIEGTMAANYVIEPYTTFSDATFARNAVRFERRLELAMEGHRLFDLRRWGIATEVLNEYVENESRIITAMQGTVSPYTSTFDVLPIPINAIDLSGAVLQQNPGY